MATSAAENQGIFARLRAQGDIVTRVPSASWSSWSCQCPLTMDMFLAPRSARSGLAGHVHVNNLFSSPSPNTPTGHHLFRLSLNVATTRLILMGGHGGADAAGNIIQTFGRSSSAETMWLVWSSSPFWSSSTLS